MFLLREVIKIKTSREKDTENRFCPGVPRPASLFYGYTKYDHIRHRNPSNYDSMSMLSTINYVKSSHKDTERVAIPIPSYLAQTLKSETLCVSPSQHNRLPPARRCDSNPTTLMHRRPGYDAVLQSVLHISLSLSPSSLSFSFFFLTYKSLFNFTRELLLARRSRSRRGQAVLFLPSLMLLSFVLAV